MPNWLSWLTYVFPMTYAIRLVLVYEFVECEEGLPQTYCDVFLERNGVDPDETWWYWIVLMVQFVIFRLFALFILRQKAKQFY